MAEMYCKNCAHYYQHYTFDKRRIFRVYCGHCALTKSKRKPPDTRACENFVWAPPDESAFATKEYISKELLQYLTKLEFLPQIEDTGKNLWICRFSFLDKKQHYD